MSGKHAFYLSCYAEHQNRQKVHDLLNKAYFQIITWLHIQANASEDRAYGGPTGIRKMLSWQDFSSDELTLHLAISMHRHSIKSPHRSLTHCLVASSTACP